MIEVIWSLYKLEILFSIMSFGILTSTVFLLYKWTRPKPFIIKRRGYQTYEQFRQDVIDGRDIDEILREARIRLPEKKGKKILIKNVNGPDPRDVLWLTEFNNMIKDLQNHGIISSECNKSTKPEQNEEPRFKVGQWVRVVSSKKFSYHNNTLGRVGAIFPVDNKIYIDIMHPEVKYVPFRLDDHIEPAYPKAGEWWKWMWQDLPLEWLKPGKQYVTAVRLGHLFPVNFGKGE